MEYHSTIKRNEIVSLAETWMDLKSVMQSEVSQKEKNKHCILMHICEIYKNSIKGIIQISRSVMSNSL